jgi:hypothetical protein
MERQSMSRVFRILYGMNAALIIIALSVPMLKIVGIDLSFANLLFGYWIVTMALSVSLFPSFLGLNLYAAIKDREHRRRYITVAALTLAGMTVGLYQLIYAYFHDISP